jgi:1,4-alpha-glucan branching enzyme
MKKNILLFLSIFALHFTQAQLLSWSPQFPSHTTGITITMDATKGNKALENFTPTTGVYIHTGVITNLSVSSSDWKYVATTWATTTSTANCTFIGSNKWTFTIPNIRTFYNVPAGEQILKISLLFRSGNGMVVQRNADGSDMYIPLNPDATSTYARINEPFKEPKFTPTAEPITKTVGDNIAITAVSNNSTALNITFNGTQVATSATNTVSASPTITTFGTQRIIATATNGATSSKDTLDFFVSPNTTIAPLPAGVKDGINIVSPTSVTLVLRAPGKSKVEVIGDFNNWTPTLATVCNKTADGQFFWVTLTGLTAGQQYGFQYVVDNTIKTGDPYAELVLDQFNDQYINEATVNPNTYPGLKPYPTGLTTGNVSVFQTNAPAYNWSVTNFVRPNKKNLVIYEVLLRDFVKNHDWKTLTDTLSYFKRLGVNAIQIMPFNEFDGNNSWGYNPSYFCAPDKYYGPKNTLKAFIDSCHKNGIAVIMDIAMNHASGASPLAQLYWNSSTNNPAANNPWFNVTATHPFSVYNDFNHESQNTKYYTKRVIEHWLTEYKLDGFRWDLSKGFTQVNSGGDVGAWSNYDASRIAIWQDYSAYHQTVSPGSYCTLEHLGVNSEEIVLGDNEMMLWGKGWEQFKQAGIGFTSNSNLSQNILHTDRGWSKQHIIGYAHSHDEERIMYESLNNGNLANSAVHNPRDTTTAIKRMEAVGAMLLALPGPKMLWQFEELAYPFSINTCANLTVNNNCRTDQKPIRWDYNNDPRRTALYNVYAKMANLRKRENYAYENLFVNGFIAKDFGGDVKWLRVTDPSLNIVLISNFGVTNVSNYALTFPSNGKWYNYLTGDSITVSLNTFNFNLAAGQYFVFTSKNFNPVTVTGIGPVNAPILNMKVAIYPNPIMANGVANLKFDLPESGNLSVSLINIAGQEVMQIFKGNKGRGTQILQWNNNKALAAGSYLIKTVLNGKSRLDKIQIY